MKSVQEDVRTPKLVNSTCHFHRRRGPWKNFEAVELATLEWVNWFNNRRLLEPIGNIPLAEFEQAYNDEVKASARVAGLTQNGLWETQGGSLLPQNLDSERIESS